MSRLCRADSFEECWVCIPLSCFGAFAVFDPFLVEEKEEVARPSSVVDFALGEYVEGIIAD